MDADADLDIGGNMYEGPAKSFVTGFALLQCYIFFITNLQSIPPLLKHIFVTFLPNREKQKIVFFCIFWRH